MRLPSLILAAWPALWMAVGLAQEPPDEALRELLCERCPFDAPVRPLRRDDLPPQRSITVIRAEDMQALGVVSVADMIEQIHPGPEQDAAPVPEEIPDDADIDRPERSQEPDEADSR